MPIQVQTSLMNGGLDLATPPIALPPGKASAAINYEPDIGGYTSFGGYERFDGRDRPSDSTVPATIASRRAAIGVVPGTGPVRGVWVFDGSVWAFRDQDDGLGGFFKAGAGGWTEQGFGKLLEFSTGTAEFTAGEIVTGGTSTATATIDRVVLRSGNWSGTAAGFLIVSGDSGTFSSLETITSTSGSAAVVSPPVPLTLAAGGRYDFVNHNFYGATDRNRMYWASGADTAYEWSGSVLTPIMTGVSSGVAVGAIYVLEVGSGFIKDATDTDFIILSAQYDAPSFLAQFKNHLFLAFSSGTLLNSSIGEPLEWSTTAGAGETSFGSPITGLLSAASTSLVIFGQNRIDYITGTDTTTFLLEPISNASGAQPYTVQMMDAPMFLDDGGIRSMPTTAAFGDWRIASTTQAIEVLMRQKRDTGVQAMASMTIKGKDQYRLFWDDGSGITVFIGRKNPESLPFKLPIEVFCACSGEVNAGLGDRLFVGAEDGFVYEMNRGTSYDGAVIDSYIRLPFTAAGSPMQQTRWMKVSFELDTPDDIDVGVAFHTDYARGDGGVLTSNEVDAGSAIITTALYNSVDWTQPVEGRLEYHLAAIGPNISATLVHSASDKRQHTLSAQTYNFSRRRLKR